MLPQANCWVSEHASLHVFVPGALTCECGKKPYSQRWEPKPALRVIEGGREGPSEPDVKPQND